VTTHIRRKYNANTSRLYPPYPLYDIRAPNAPQIPTREPRKFPPEGRGGRAENIRLAVWKIALMSAPPTETKQ
jgi:hypothetical protein